MFDSRKKKLCVSKDVAFHQNSRTLLTRSRNFDDELEEKESQIDKKPVIEIDQNEDNI